MNSPWGHVQHQTELLEGAVWISTASHGGILIPRTVAESHLSVEAIQCGFAWIDQIAFEEDVAVSAPCYEWDALRQALDNSVWMTRTTKEDFREDLRVWYANEYNLEVEHKPVCAA